MGKGKREKIQEGKRKTSKNLVIGIAIAVVIAIGVAAFAASNNPSQNSSQYKVREAGNEGSNVGDIAPNLELTTIDGEKITTAGFVGKPVILWFMAVWCPTCVGQADTLKQINTNFGDRIEIITIDMWSPNILSKLPRDIQQRFGGAETEDDLRRFKDRFGGDWHWTFDTDDAVFRYGVTSVDSTVVVNPDGTIGFKFPGPTGYPTLVKAVENAINNKPTNLQIVHEHAKFAVYLNGDPVDFSLRKYQVKDRFIHVEGGDGTTLHKHVAGMNLGDFFSSLGMKFTRDCFILDNGESYCNGDDKTLKFYVNGEQNSMFDNYEPMDGDKILISYGSESEDQIIQQLSRIG